MLFFFLVSFLPLISANLGPSYQNLISELASFLAQDRHSAEGGDHIEDGNQSLQSSRHTATQKQLHQALRVAPDQKLFLRLQGLGWDGVCLPDNFDHSALLAILCDLGAKSKSWFYDASVAGVIHRIRA